MTRSASESMTLEQRAEAAEKTVEVLKRKIVALYDGTGKVAIQRQLEQAQRRSEATQRRRELSDLRAAELERHSSRLEAEVAERTLTIRTILDNVAFGFLLIGPDMIACEGYSKSCTALLGTQQIAGRGLPELLRLSPREHGDLEVALSQVFDDVLPEEVSLAQARSRFRVGEKALALTYRVVRNADGFPSQILVTVNDATALDAAEREAQHNRMVLGIFKQRDAFRAFVADSLRQLETAKALIADQPGVRRAVHTIKGNAACFDMVTLIDVTHRVEESPTIGAPQLAEIEAALQVFLEQYRDLLGARFDGSCVLEVSEAKSRELSVMANRPSVPPAIRRWAGELPLRPIADLLGPLATMVGRVALRLDKAVHFQLEGGAVQVDVIALRPIVAVLSHLLKNAISHGIEARHERAPKPELATLTLRASETDREWRLSVHDDGAGIDVERVVTRAIELGALTRAQADKLDLQGKLDLLAVDRLSTAEEVTSISGRGVGMSAVLAAVKQAGGYLRVTTERRKFTCFTLHLPKPELLFSAAVTS